MSTQLSIFPDPDAPSPPYQRHSKTSVAAARSVKGKAARDRARIVAWLALMGPASDQMIQDGLEMPESTERPRRIECVTLGLVVASDKTVKTRSGRDAVAWKVSK